MLCYQLIGLSECYIIITEVPTKCWSGNWHTTAWGKSCGHLNYEINDYSFIENWNNMWYLNRVVAAYFVKCKTRDRFNDLMRCNLFLKRTAQECEWNLKLFEAQFNSQPCLFYATFNILLCLFTFHIPKALYSRHLDLSDLFMPIKSRWIDTLGTVPNSLCL